MDLIETIRMRRSCRAFQDEPIPRELLVQLLSDASNAPSAINMQPWEVTIVLGEERKRLSKRLIRAFRERGMGCGPGASRPLPDRCIQRARESADAMTSAYPGDGSATSGPMSMKEVSIFTAHPLLPYCSLTNRFLSTG